MAGWGPMACLHHAQQKSKLTWNMEIWVDEEYVTSASVQELLKSWLLGIG